MTKVTIDRGVKIEISATLVGALGTIGSAIGLIIIFQSRVETFNLDFSLLAATYVALLFILSTLSFLAFELKIALTEIEIISERKIFSPWFFIRRVIPISLDVVFFALWAILLKWVPEDKIVKVIITEYKFDKDVAAVFIQAFIAGTTLIPILLSMLREINFLFSMLFKIKMRKNLKEKKRS